MKQLELNLERIALKAKQKEKENFDFRVYLKGLDFEYVDSIVHKLNEQITSQIDCQQCGNCCNTLTPCLTESEIKRLSQLDNLPQAEYMSRFVEIDDIEGITYLKDTPCKYLKNGSCSIYPDRPEECASYPNTHKTEFITRTLGMIDNYGICPIVFNLFEQLKVELGYK